MPAPTHGQSRLAAIQGQISRYGCDHPPYNQTSQACLDLNAQARALQSGPYTSPRRVRSYQPHRRQPSLLERLFGRSQRRSTPGSIWGDFGWGQYGSSSYHSRRSGYRTRCVRLCDGYYWPISYSATGSGLKSDADRCENSCSAPARLFYQASPGDDATYMVDLSGKRYTDIPNAFRYRKEYMEGCKCKPEPWSEAAREDYKGRAEQQAAEQQTAEMDQRLAGAEEAPPGAEWDGDEGAIGARAGYRSAMGFVTPTTRRWSRPRPRVRRPARSTGGLFGNWR